MKFKFNYYWFLALAPCLFILWYYKSKKEDLPIRTLAYFGPKNTLRVNDTSYHLVPDFKFIDQDSAVITEATTKGKIYLSEFFFTTCQSICPVMNTNLEKVYKEFRNDSSFLILSHTVDPETDHPTQLKRYAELHGVKDKRWLFLTGEKTKLYEIARKGYLLNAEDGNGGEDDFIHTQNFALVDKERHIRGFYDGTDSLEIQRLIQEIHLLEKEYEHNAKLHS